MGFEVISKKELSNLKKFIKTKRALLYLNDDKLLKIFNTKPYLNSYSKNRLSDIANFQVIDCQEKVLMEVSKIKEKEFVIPNNILYKDEVVTHNLIGYDMEYLKEYVKLEEFLLNNKLSFNKKIKLSEKLCEIFIGLEKYKISYWDIHASNVMTDGNELRVIDIDSVTSKDSSGEFTYRVDLSCSYSNLASLILSILYDVDENYLLQQIKSGKINPLLKKNELFKSVIEFDGRIFYPNKYLNNFTEEYIEETRKLILKK